MSMRGWHRTLGVFGFADWIDDAAVDRSALARDEEHSALGNRLTLDYQAEHPLADHSDVGDCPATLPETSRTGA